MKKLVTNYWLGLSFLMVILCHSQNAYANNPLNCACIGNDTLICDFTYQISPLTPGGQWSVLCDSTDGSVDFEMVDPLTMGITVSNCGEYHLIYTVDDGTCMSSDTAIFTIGDPSFGSVAVESGATLGYDGTVFCHESPGPSSCNPTSMGGGPPPSVSWDVCGEATGMATIFSTDVMGDMPNVCLADEITVSSEDFSDFADLGCTNYSEADFLANFFAILAGSGSPAFDSLDIPFATQCFAVGQVDTIYNDSIYTDTITYLIPYRVGGQWNYIMDDGELAPLDDTTNIVVSDSSLILIVEPGSDYYGPDDIEWSVFVENDMMQWVDPTYDIEFMVQWVEEFAYDTLIQIIESDSITIIAQTCNGFGYSNNFAISGPPTYPCGPVTLEFNFSTPPDPLVANLLFTQDDACFFCDGAAVLNVQGGCPPYSQTEFYGLCPGSYSFTVTDANGNVSNPVDVDIFGWDSPFITDIIVIDDECEQNMGSITIEASGGFPPYNYSIGGGFQNSNTFSGLPAGNYSIEIIDLNGCSDFSSATINTTFPPDVSISGNLSICPGEFTTLFADSDAIDFNWSTGENSPSITVSSPGQYCVIATSQEGCTTETCVIVTEEFLNPPTISGNLEVCPNEQTTLDAGNGYSTYVWDTGSTNQQVSVGAGSYCVTVSNNVGCTAESCVTVTESNDLDVFIDGNLEVCNGEQTTLTANGNFTNIEWDTGDTSPSITVGEGTYCVTVTNGNGCAGEACVTVIETTPPPINIFGDTQMCEGTSAFISADGNFDFYQWDNGDSGQSITVFNGGTYCVTAGIGNCLVNACWEVTEVANPEPMISGDTTIPAGGSVTLSTGAFDTYLWSNLETTDNITVATAGIYCVTVTNAEGCTGEDCIEVTENEPNLSPNITGDSEFCENESISLGVDGNYATYLWSNGETTPTILINQGGTYSVTVSDGNGNTGTTSEMIIENALPTINAMSSNDISCIETEALLSGDGSSTGANISYNWQNSQGVSVSDNLNFSTNLGDTYALIVTDLNNNCIATQTVIVEENTTPPELLLATNQTLPCDGGIQIVPTNTPASNYSYSWTNIDGNPITAASSSMPTVEVPGTYEVFITDLDNGCTNTNSTDILANESAAQGVNLSLQNPICFGDTDGEIIIENVIDGTGPFLFSIDGSPFAENMNFDNLPAGSFELSVESQTSGCIYTEVVTLTEGDQVNLELGDDLIISLGETIEVGAQSFLDETIIDNILWETTADITCDTCLTNPFLLLENTIIDLTVTSENGCIVSDQIQILVENNTEIYAPNVFSPNNDGVNDRFTIYANSESVNVTKFTIFDRWGSLVFETNDIVPNEESLGWDGQFKGKTAKDGLYIYMAEVVYLNGQTDVLKGDILVIGGQ